MADNNASLGYTVRFLHRYRHRKLSDIWNTIWVVLTIWHHGCNDNSLVWWIWQFDHWFGPDHYWLLKWLVCYRYNLIHPYQDILTCEWYKTVTEFVYFSLDVKDFKTRKNYQGSESNEKTTSNNCCRLIDRFPRYNWDVQHLTQIPKNGFDVIYVLFHMLGFGVLVDIVDLNQPKKQLV